MPTSRGFSRSGPGPPMHRLSFPPGLQRFVEALVSTEQVGCLVGAYAHFARDAALATASTRRCAPSHCSVVARANAPRFITARTRETRGIATTCSGDAYDEKPDRASKCL